ncbi:hypothetical protein B0H65DRAFT_260078 [Neurospora tetraspora]|uniref:Uncharacterized protein n=1 Tax=Neurospora tetraspora TaxID=94610 RepID=A0AAE0JB73_9PEZI|nr:hypothetical protein B0H65DRAFT_260078 [Neurospora tetraspora]
MGYGSSSGFFVLTSGRCAGAGLTFFVLLARLDSRCCSICMWLSKNRVLDDHLEKKQKPVITAIVRSYAHQRYYQFQFQASQGQGCRKPQQNEKNNFLLTVRFSFAFAQPDLFPAICQGTVRPVRLPGYQIPAIRLEASEVASGAGSVQIAITYPYVQAGD